MLAKDALEIVLDPGPGFYSRLFLVEKATGGWCPMIDLSHLNEFVLQTSFKMETVASVLLSVREGDSLAFIDLDMYFQIPVHQSSRNLLRFLPSSPRLHPDIVSDISVRISSVTGSGPGDREDVGQGCLGDCPRSGSRLLQSSFPGGKGDGRLASCDRPLSPERVCSANFVQDGDRSLRATLCPGGGFPGFHRLGHVFPDTCSSVVEEPIEVSVVGGGGGVSTSSRPCVSDCRLSLRSSPGCLQRSLHGLTPAGFFSSIWTTGWSSPLRRPWPKRTSRICFPFVTPSG